MPSSAWLWLPIALFAPHFSTFLWRKGRRNQRFAFSELLLAGAAGYTAWTFGPELWGSGLLFQAVTVALWWSAATPVLVFGWYGFGGRIRQVTGRLVGALLCAIVATLVASSFLSLRNAVGVGVGSALLLLAVPWLRPRLRRWRWRRTQLREERRTQRQAERARRLDEQVLHQAQQQAQEATERLRLAEAEIERLQRQEQQQAQRLARQRAEVLQQVQQVRDWERSQIQSEGSGMVVHPSSFGFLLLEAGRVLRAEIAAGERIPPLENDQFLLEVAERLIAADDFIARYLHRKGRDAASALHRFLSGENSLGKVRGELQRLDLEPHELAPCPLPGHDTPELLEAWLIPQRRYQEQQRQRFIAGQHPQQEALTEFFRAREIDAPEVQEWQDCWDALPASFVHGRKRAAPAPFPQQPRPSPTSLARARRWINEWPWDRWWTRLASFTWNRPNAAPTSTAPASPDPEKPAGSST